MRPPDLDFHDTRLTPDAAPQCALAAVLGPDGLTYTVTHGPAGEVWALGSWQFDGVVGAEVQQVETAMRQALANKPLLGWSFGRVRLAMFNAQATLAPRRLFDPQQLPDYFKLLLREGDFAYGYDEVEGADCMLAYAVEPTLLALYRHYFPMVQPVHLAANLLTTWQRLARPDHADVFAHFRPRHVLIAGYDRGQLLFYNAFPFTAASDVLYFLLLAYQQMRLAPADIPLMLSGHLLRDSDIFRTLQRGFGDLRFAAPPAPLQLSEDGVEMPPAHFFFDLISAG